MEMAASQVDQDMEFLRELIQDFMEEFNSKKESSTELVKRMAKDKKAVKEVQSRAHAVKGSALNIALRRVAALSLKLESQAKVYVSEDKCPSDEEAKAMGDVWDSLCNEATKVQEQYDAMIKEKEKEED